MRNERAKEEIVFTVEQGPIEDDGTGVPKDGRAEGDHSIELRFRVRLEPRNGLTDKQPDDALQMKVAQATNVGKAAFFVAQKLKECADGDGDVVLTSAGPPALSQALKIVAIARKLLDGQDFVVRPSVVKADKTSVEGSDPSRLKGSVVLRCRRSPCP